MNAPDTGAIARCVQDKNGMANGLKAADPADFSAASRDIIPRETVLLFSSGALILSAWLFSLKMYCEYKNAAAPRGYFAISVIVQATA